MFEVYIAKVVFLPNFLNNKFPFMLPSHNCIIIITMFSFQGASLNLFYKKLNEASISWCFSQSLVVESTGIEPVTSCLQGRRSPSWANPPYGTSLKWWAKMDSNHRPHDYQSCALASWAIGPYQLHFFFRYITDVPSKLNNALSNQTLCTDLRTLQDKSSFTLKSP